MMLQFILSQIGVPALIKIIERVLVQSDDPVFQETSRALSSLSRKLGAGEVADTLITQFNKDLADMRLTDSEIDQKTIEQINQSLRTEMISDDKYVRRMRPTFGYIMAFSWAAQMFAIAYVIIFDTARSGLVMSALSSLSAIWAVGLSVLGVYVYRRSDEKKQASLNPVFWNEEK